MKTILIFVAVMLLSLFVLAKREGSREFKPIDLGGTELRVLIANSEQERVRGLSGVESLVGNEGMLFVFEEAGYYGIWMKDMKFPLDIAWLDTEKRIVHIEHGVSPETYPKVFNASKASMYVIETNAGFFEKAKIKIGAQASFDF